MVACRLGSWIRKSQLSLRNPVDHRGPSWGNIERLRDPEQRHRRDLGEHHHPRICCVAYRSSSAAAVESSLMVQDFGWLKHQGDKPEPRLERIATLWRMRGTSGRNIECAAFRTETGMELRTMYSPEEIIASQLFRGVDADEKIAEAADQWRLNLFAKGFSDAE